jgi:ribonuclease P protein component
VAFVANRRVGGAVQRNRAKRRLREAMRHVALEPGTAYIVQATPDVLEAPFSQLIDWLSAASGPTPDGRGQEDE